MMNMDQRVGSLERNAYAGIAAATALTMVPDVSPGKNFAMGIGVGKYRGYGATAIGIAARINDRIKVKAGLGMSSGGNTFGGGAAYEW